MIQLGSGSKDATSAACPEPVIKELNFNFSLTIFIQFEVFILYNFTFYRLIMY